MDKKTLWQLSREGSKVSVLDIYHAALREAQEQREYAKKLPDDDEQKAVILEGARALYEVCAALENTEEVNPTK